ncbi:hypothetical protein N9L12_05935, partial [Luminiphilus sp.]|nr:hypothetical protein [Luminiphilus sp.]
MSKSSRTLYRSMWLATLAFCHFSFASTDVSFWNSSVNNRLNQIEVRAVLQDGSGALWFATQEGLTRYNGVRADTFSAANSESGGLQPGEVRSFSVSTEGHLWVLTNTLQVFVPETQSFSVYPGLDDTLFPNTIAFDADGLLWVGLDGAVGLINATTGSVEAFDLPDILQFDSDQLAPSSSLLVKLLPYQDTVLGVNSLGVFEFRKSSSGTVVITPITDFTKLVSSVVNTAEISGGNLFVGTVLDGMIVVDLETRETTLIGQGTNDNELPSDTVTALLADDDGIWIGTPNGLVYTQDRGRSFQHYTAFASGLPSNWITGLYKSNDGSYWVGTRQGLAQGARTQFDSFNTTNARLSSNHTNAVHQDVSGTLWVGTQDGLNKLPLGANQFEWINSA